MAGAPSRGDDAERQARAYLEDRGLVTLAVNYRCPPGELDLVMRDGETVVFVEVRFRARGSCGSAAESVDHRKQRRVATAARHYLQRAFPGKEPPCRFDVVAFDGPSQPPVLRWIHNAFDA